MRERLRRVGLVAGVGLSAITLGEFMTRYFDALAVKPSTVTAYTNTRRNLEAKFGATRALRSLDEADADAFRGYLGELGLSPATVSKRIIVARQMWKRAVRWKLASENIFEHVDGGSQRNEARNVFVPIDTVERVIGQCRDVEWKLIIALARYGALRTPSETFALTWRDVDFEKGAIRVSSPKTEHHDGHGSRIVPMWPRLRELLTEGLERADEGAVFVISRHRRDESANLRTQFQRLIVRAGLTDWPRLFQNLRSSRVTELLREFDLATVANWAGHSPAILARHYATSIDKNDDFKRAVAFDGLDSSPARAHHRAQHSAQQHATEPKRTELSAESNDAAKQGENDTECTDVHSGSFGCKSGGMGVTGLEPVTSSV
ncbi:MAG: tyrosine-type recombinase/integrase [Phycisphaerae bacterium]